jgi:hypothetical protein
MSDEWFYRTRDDQEVGPLRPSELLELVRRGSVSENTLLKKSGSAWFAAKNVGGLFAAATAVKPKTRMCCPNCGYELKAVPVPCRNCGQFVERPKVVTETAVAPAEPRAPEVSKRLGVGGLVKRLVPRNPK